SFDRAADGNGYMVTMSGQAPQVNGVMRGTLTIETNVPEEESVRVQVFGAVSPSAAAQATPQRLRNTATTNVVRQGG
ncbi:MAG: hypothetical protein AAF747_08420, partial [Planctomycetota bacterium]